MIHIITAIKSEADALLNICDHSMIAPDFYGGNFNDIPFTLCVCGVGKANAAAGTQRLIERNAELPILNFGTAGGFGNAKMLEVYSVGQSVQYDFDLDTVNHCGVGVLNELDTPYLKSSNPSNSAFPTGILATGDRFCDGTADFKLFEYFKANLRDMGGAAIAQIALKYNVPCFIYKAVSDIVGDRASSTYNATVKAAHEQLSEAMCAIFAEVVNSL